MSEKDFVASIVRGFFCGFALCLGIALAKWCSLCFLGLISRNYRWEWLLPVLVESTIGVSGGAGSRVGGDCNFNCDRTLGSFENFSLAVILAGIIQYRLLGF